MFSGLDPNKTINSPKCDCLFTIYALKVIFLKFYYVLNIFLTFLEMHGFRSKENISNFRLH